MQHLLAWKQFHKTGIKMQKFARGDDYRVIWKVISNSREKFVVLDCPPDIITDVVNASKFFNMTGAFNVQVFKMIAAKFKSEIIFHSSIYL